MLSLQPSLVPMIYSVTITLRDITPHIVISTPPPAETFAVDAILTTVPVYYRFDNNHLHTIQAILASSASGVQIKADAVLSSRLSKTFAVDIILDNCSSSISLHKHSLA